MFDNYIGRICIVEDTDGELREGLLEDFEGTHYKVVSDNSVMLIPKEDVVRVALKLTRIK